MAIYLNKFLPALVSPLAIILYLLAFSLLVNARWPRVLAMVVTLVASNPLIGERAIRYLEKDYPPIPLANVPEVDAVIVLGGMIRTVWQPGGATAREMTDRVDRLEAGLALMALEKSDTIVFTRGAVAWSVGEPEGDYLRELAIGRGLDPARIRLTGIVENTADEAREVAGMMPDGQQIALVTSAFHMPRAMQVFQRYGLDIVPVPVDYMAVKSRLKPNDLLPSDDALMKTSLFVREMIGRLYYAIKG